MYIGKETNTWVNQKGEKTVEEVERCYQLFLAGSKYKIAHFGVFFKI